MHKATAALGQFLHSVYTEKNYIGKKGCLVLRNDLMLASQSCPGATKISCEQKQ